MITSRLILLVLLVLGLSGCKHELSRAERAKALMREGNELLQQDSNLTNQWTAEYKTGFRPDVRAQFPGNRDVLRAHAEKIMNLLDQSSGLTRRVAEKYEQASALSDNDAERRGVALIATSLKETVVAHQLYKSQMRLVSDEKITDQKTFEEKFKHYLDQITQQQRERDEHYSQGKRLLGL